MLHLSRLAALILLLVLVPCAALGADPSYLTCAIVATDDLELRPLELNQRDVVSVLDRVYEGLFSMDDNYMPQPKLAYSYEFISDGRRLRVKLRDDVTFHNGQRHTTICAGNILPIHFLNIHSKHLLNSSQTSYRYLHR